MPVIRRWIPPHSKPTLYVGGEYVTEDAAFTYTWVRIIKLLTCQYWVHNTKSYSIINVMFWLICYTIYCYISAHLLFLTYTAKLNYNVLLPSFYGNMTQCCLPGSLNGDYINDVWCQWWTHINTILFGGRICLNALQMLPLWAHILALKFHLQSR